MAKTAYPVTDVFVRKPVGEGTEDFSFVVRGSVGYFYWRDTLYMPTSPIPDFDIDWGDGTIQAAQDALPWPTSTYFQHNYAFSADWIITIKNYKTGWFHFRGMGPDIIKMLTPLPKQEGRIDFSRLFNVCFNLISVSSYFFKNNPQAENFSSMFYSCTSLQTIDSNIFFNNVNAVNFDYCFSNCHYLTTIPSDLFRHCVNAINFWGCFAGDDRLENIPYDLFQNNMNVIRFNDCFANCFDIVNTSVPAGVAPELWLRTTPNLTGARCFSNGVRLSNYAQIPSSWK